LAKAKLSTATSISTLVSARSAGGLGQSGMCGV
jgi:hypothetical protein